MTKRFRFSLLGIALIAFLSVGYLTLALSSENSGCVKCHTDEQILKSLFKPPKAGPSEGEG